MAFPTLPTLPALLERIDPDGWLASLDQKIYLRHVGRDGCVDVDLSTCYIGHQMAGYAVLKQVRAENRQFAVWHQSESRAAGCDGTVSQMLLPVMEL